VAGVIWFGLWFMGGWPWCVLCFSILLLSSRSAVARGFEDWIQQTDALGVARLAVDVVVALSAWPALAEGNIIELGPRMVGGKRSRSGVRSLPDVAYDRSTLGELKRFSILRRGAGQWGGPRLAWRSSRPRFAIELSVWVAANRGTRPQSKVSTTSLGYLISSAFFLDSLGVAELASSAVFAGRVSAEESRANAIVRKANRGFF